MTRQDKPRLQHNYRYQKPGRWETSSCLPILRIPVLFPGDMEGSRHSFLTPELMVSEEQGGAANGSILENWGPEWQLYCRKEGVGAVGLGIPRGLDIIAWFRGCGCVSTWAQGG